jgi:hypothetical protein
MDFSPYVVTKGRLKPQLRSERRKEI